MTDLHVEVRAGAAPALVWGHGLLQSISTEPIDARALDVPNEIVVYDARNHGSSPDASSPDDLKWPALADDMRAVADHTGHEQFVAAGVSMGAATALTVAVETPERVRGLVLCIPPTAWTVRWGQRTLYGTIGTVASLIPVGGVRRASRSLRGASRTDLPPLAELGSIDVPTIVFAWHLDPAHPAAIGRKIAATIRGADFVTSKRPGDAEGWSERLEQFLTDL